MARAMTFVEKSHMHKPNMEAFFPTFICLQTSLNRGMLNFLKHLNLGNSVEQNKHLKCFP